MNVAAIIVTRGDVDLTPVLASLPEEWETLVWDNGARLLVTPRDNYRTWQEVPDLSVYGRYAAIEHTDADLIYVQDDDCVVSDPQVVAGEWQFRCNEWNRTEHLYTEGTKPPWPGVVCNMPSEFRHEFYEEHALVGFGACFHRDAPQQAFSQFLHEEGLGWPTVLHDLDFFHRTCDIVFTALTPRVLVDVPVESLPHAHYEDRMWKQPGHLAERVRMLDLVREIA